MDKERETAIVYRGFVDFEAQGKTYQLKPFSLQEIISGKHNAGGVIIPNSDNPGYFQLLNLEDKERRVTIGKWLEEYLTYQDIPVTLETISGENGHGWDLIDLGRFLLDVIQTSG